MLPLAAHSLDNNLFERGKQSAKKCILCHGENGMASNNLIPNLAGQNEKYILKQLKDFRSRRRFNSAMRQMVTGLKDAELEALAHYYSHLSP